MLIEYIACANISKHVSIIAEKLKMFLSELASFIAQCHSLVDLNYCSKKESGRGIQNF